MQKILLSVLLTAVIAIGGTYLFLQKGQSTSSAESPITYGTFCCFLTGQDLITYPLIFQNIRVYKDQIMTDTHQKQSAVIFDTIYKGFDVSMNVLKVSRKEADDALAMTKDRNVETFEGTKRTVNGYEGQIFSDDLKAHPKLDTQECSFGYNDTIPLADSKEDIILGINIAQRDWGNSTPCRLFDDENYLPLKAMVDHIIDNIQPAF